MGLDMFAWRVKSQDVIDDFTIVSSDTGKVEEIKYWRKHHNLHGWMESLYRAKGGENDVFNCQKVRLTLEDLDKLEADVMDNRLPDTTGFFFGNNPPDLDSIAEDLQFIVKARQVINEGDAVYYDSWW